jgi:hypothetical protein
MFSHSHTQRFFNKKGVDSKGYLLLALESALVLFLLKEIDKSMGSFNALVGKNACSRN